MISSASAVGMAKHPSSCLSVCSILETGELRSRGRVHEIPFLAQFRHGRILSHLTLRRVHSTQARRFRYIPELMISVKAQKMGEGISGVYRYRVIISFA